ncbi:MAG: class I SAM-dependent methyltransferase [Candidatus Omnitrophica bacterium]|nr:class I SAM-dependent methyltransferase [Candidatus Omnitrophota bacterium]
MIQKTEIENYYCPICECKRSINAREIGRSAYMDNVKPFLSIKECAKCGFGFRYPLLTNDIILSHYYDNINYWQGKLVENNIYFKKRAMNRIEFIRDIFSKSRRDSKMLEVGAYNGAFLQLVRKVFGFHNLYATETDEACIGYMNSRNIKCSKKIENNKFSLIAMFHVLEHYPEPLAFLKEEVIPYLDKDGFVFIEVPYDDVRKKEINCLRTSNHTSFFSKESFKIISKKTGLSLIKMESFGKENKVIKKILTNQYSRFFLNATSFLERKISGHDNILPYFYFLSINDAIKNDKGIVLRVLLKKY